MTVGYISFLMKLSIERGSFSWYYLQRNLLDSKLVSRCTEVMTKVRSMGYIRPLTCEDAARDTRLGNLYDPGPKNGWTSLVSGIDVEKLIKKRQSWDLPVSHLTVCGGEDLAKMKVYLSCWLVCLPVSSSRLAAADVSLRVCLEISCDNCNKALYSGGGPSS